jgi:hypothetical protein
VSHYQKTERACELWSRQGIKVFAFLMMFNAWEENGRLVHETPEEVNNTIRFVYRMWFQRKLHYASWAPAVPVPGAELYDIFVRHGKIDMSYLPDDGWQAHEYLDDLSEQEFRSIYRKSLFQGGFMALMSGNVEWRNWRMILKNARTMMFGRPESAVPERDGNQLTQES